MTRRTPYILAALAVPLLWLATAARAQVHDNAHLFSAQAVTDADAAIAQMQQRHNKGFVVETFASVPVEQKDLAQKDKRAFFKHWSTERFNATGANGVYALICMDPKYVEVRCGPETEKRGDFTQADIGRLAAALKADLGAKRNDDALSGGVDAVERAYTANIGGSAPAPRSAAGSGTPAPAQSYPSAPSGNASHNSSGMFGLGGLICLVVGAVIIFTLIKSAFGNRNNQGGGFGGNAGGGGTGFGGGGGSYPTGGPNYGPGYGPGYGAPPRAGGGFGSGFLGGLLGGAVGGYAVDKFEHRNDPSSTAGFTGGGDSGGSFGGGGGTPGYDAGPSDAGQLTDNNGGDAGGDFGGDFGGGGDSGGGDSGGGDSGGGDSGGSF